MKEFKGTPGPWVAVNNGYFFNVRPENEGQNLASTQINQYLEIDDEIEEHNANLIAAAPELLEALQWALEWIDAVPSETQLPTMPGFDRDYVNEIINKALGK